MKNQTGAHRPAMTRKLKSIAVAAIVLILGLGAAVYAQDGNNWYGMGPDNIMGMMPPNGMRMAAGSHQTIPPCSPRPDIVLTQHASKGTITYVSSKSGCIYTISREGKPWLTVTYDASTKTYKLTDPTGTHDLLLELGIDPGKFNPWVGPTTKKKTK
jgi:hypothetical protein